LGHERSKGHGIPELHSHGARPEEENFSSEEPNAAAMNPFFNRVSEETTRPRISAEGFFSYNSEKLGDSTIDRP
jgi:hypothetical protein